VSSNYPRAAAENLPTNWHEDTRIKRAFAFVFLRANSWAIRRFEITFKKASPGGPVEGPELIPPLLLQIPGRPAYDAKPDRSAGTV
jgi:hypothetical protein